MFQVIMCQMLEVGVYFGYQICYWNLKMVLYIFGVRGKIYIINLEKIVLLFNDVMNFILLVVQKCGIVLFLGIKCSVCEIIKEEVECCGMLFMNQCWLGGILINFCIVKQLVVCLKELEVGEIDGIFEKLVKYEVLGLCCECDKLEVLLGGIKDMNCLLDVIFVIDIGYEDIVIKEVKKLGILVIVVVDINYNLELVDYVILGNDDVICVVQLYVCVVVDVVLEGKVVVLYVVLVCEEEFVEVVVEGEEKLVCCVLVKKVVKKGDDVQV